MVWLVGFVFHEMDMAGEGEDGNQGGMERKKGKDKKEQVEREGRKEELEQSEALGWPLVFSCNVEVLLFRWRLLYFFTLFPDIEKKKENCLTEKDVYKKTIFSTLCHFSSVQTGRYLCGFQSAPLCIGSCEMSVTSYIHSGYTLQFIQVVKVLEFIASPLVLHIMTGQKE